MKADMRSQNFSSAMLHAQMNSATLIFLNSKDAEFPKLYFDELMLDKLQDFYKIPPLDKKDFTSGVPVLKFRSPRGVI